MNTSVEGYRLSPQQRRVWSVNRMTQLQTAVRVEGALKREVLVQALAELTDRHEVLRTVFHEVPGLSLPMQVVLDEVDVDWTFYEEVHPSELELKLDELTQIPFDLQKGPLLRAALLPLAGGQAIVALQVSALIADVDSSVLIQEWFRLYEAMIRYTGLDEEEEEEGITYAVISEWLNQLLEDEDSEAGRAFWARRRIDVLSAVEVPWRRDAETAPSLFSKAVEVSTDVWQSLGRTANAWGVEAQELVLVAWRSVWARVSGQHELLIGLACDGRTDEGVETALGLMTRSVPLVTRWEGRERVQDAAVEISRAAREAYEWQESWTWESVSKLDRFQIGFESRKRLAAIDAGDVRVSLWREQGQSEPYEAMLSCRFDAESADLRIQVDANLWPEEAVDQWLGALVAVLKQLGVPTGDLTCEALHFWQEATREAQAAALRGSGGANVSKEVEEWMEKLKSSELMDQFVEVWSPVSGVQVQVVDENGELVPLGAVGSLEARRIGETAWTKLQESARVWPGGRLERVRVATDLAAESGELTAPRNEVEQTLASIWQEVLGIDEIDVRDSFFDLGGHSLLATQVVMRMRAKYGVEFPMRILFETKTLEALAKAVEQAGGNAEAAGSGYASIPRLGEQELFELSPSQERLWFSAQMSQSSQFGTGFYYVLEDELHTESFARAFASVVERHAMLRTTIVVQDGVAYQRVTPGVQPTYREHDLYGRSETSQLDDVRARVLEVWTTPFDLTRESFFRVELFRLSEHKSLLFLCAHHIGYDGWAVRLFIRDLNAFYSAYRRGESKVDLPEVVPFFDAAAWLRKRLADGGLQSQLDYWLAQLQDDVIPPEVPGDSGEWEVNPLDVRSLTVSMELTSSLQELAKAQGSSLYATVLSGVMAWLSRISRETTVTVGATLSGRTHPELEEAFGPLLNPVAMRTDLSGNPTVLEIVSRAAKTSFDAYANQDYPFDLIWQELRKRGAKAPSLYSVILIGQNVTDGAVQLDGMRLEPRPLTELLADRAGEAASRLYGESGEGASPYDLVLSMSETAGGIVFEANYATGKFRPETVDRYLAQIVRVLEQFTAEPQARLSQLAVEVEAEDAWEELF